MDNQTDIFIITGTPGSGKSTVAKALMQDYEFGFHIPVDDLREWVVSGIAQPIPTWTEETTRQFDIAYTATTKIANLYAGQGFSVAIDQVIYPHDVKKHFEASLQGFNIHKIFLYPEISAARERNAKRQNKDFDTEVLDEPLIAIHRSLYEAISKDKGWLIIDSTNSSVADTVAEIMNNIKMIS